MADGPKDIKKARICDWETISGDFLLNLMRECHGCAKVKCSYFGYLTIKVKHQTRRRSVQTITGNEFVEIAGGVFLFLFLQIQILKTMYASLGFEIELCPSECFLH